MAVLDLATAEKLPDQPVIDQPVGRVLDLDTGKPVEQFSEASRWGVYPHRLLGQAASTKQEEFIPEESNESNETRATEELPEIAFSGLLSGSDPIKIAKVATAILLTPDPREIGNILTATFPEIGIIEDEKGNLIAGNNKTGVEAVINKPGMSPIDVLQVLGIGAAFTPPAQVAGLVRGLTVKAITGAAGAGVVQTGIESMQETMGGDLDEEEIFIATALGGTAEVVMPIIQGLRNMRQARKLNVEESEIEQAVPAIANADENAAGLKGSTGVDVGLFPAQKTQVPSQLQKQRLMPQLDAGSQAALKALNKQNEEVFNATIKLIDSVAPQSVSGEAPGKLMTAAMRVIKAQKLVRKEAAQFGVVVKAADEAGVIVDITPIKSQIEALFDISVQSGELERTMIRMNKFLTPRKGKDNLTFSQVQSAKKEMDAIINAIPGSDKAVDPQVLGKVIDIKKSLVEQMKIAYPPFREASETFARESGPVEEIQRSLIGRLSKTSDAQLKNISSEIFNPRTSAMDISKARASIESIDPYAWRDIVRNELDFRVGSLESQIKDAGSDSVANMPALLKRSLFGNSKQREVLYRSLTREQTKNFRYLERVLGRAASGRAAGSPTASFTEIIRELRGKLGVLKDIFTQPLRTIQETGDTSLFNRKVKALTDVMFDPKWQPRLSEIRSFDPNSPAAARAMAQLVDDSISTGLDYMKADE